MLLQLGLERLANNPHLAQDWGRCGLVCNQASVDRHFTPSWRVCQQVLGQRLTALFGPQHGFESAVQDNMIETGHALHGPTGLPIYSLYSEFRTPTEKMLEQIDTIVVDLPIVGCRVYTYKYTMAGCLRAAKEWGKRVVVLDRPNPLGGILVGGRVLDMDHRSFVGEFPLPMRHGLSVAEAARFFNHSIGATLEVVSLQGWRPEALWHELGRPWVLTSPNLPSIDPVYLFPGTVLLEGTNLSEGRGTGLPFQFVGAPYIDDANVFTQRVRELYGDSGDVYLRPTIFQPTSQKWQGQTCSGCQIHVLTPQKVRAYQLGLAIIRAGIELGGRNFAWKQPPYEYEHTKLPIRLLVGSKDSDTKFEAGSFSLDDDYWTWGLDQYLSDIAPFLLYPRDQATA
jgi:uncharacterized protein YbbC (DUF1343 family)